MIQHRKWDVLSLKFHYRCLKKYSLNIQLTLIFWIISMYTKQNKGFVTFVTNIGCPRNATVDFDEPDVSTVGEMVRWVFRPNLRKLIFRIFISPIFHARILAAEDFLRKNFLRTCESHTSTEWEYFKNDFLKACSLVIFLQWVMIFERWFVQRWLTFS